MHLTSPLGGELLDNVAPDSNVVDVAAPLLECAENLAVSIPAVESEDFTHLGILHTFMGVCGLEIPTNRYLLHVSRVNYSYIIN